MLAFSSVNRESDAASKAETKALIFSELCTLYNHIQMWKADMVLNKGRVRLPLVLQDLLQN